MTRAQALFMQACTVLTLLVPRTISCAQYQDVLYGRHPQEARHGVKELKLKESSGVQVHPSQAFFFSPAQIPEHAYAHGSLRCRWTMGLP
jgi:hypothetical protein